MLLFELIKGGLWEGYRPQIGNTPNWKKTLIQAQQQAVLGITFRGIRKLPADKRPPEPLFLKWLALTAEIQEQNREKDETAAELFALFRQEGIQAVLLKGSDVAQYYPEPALRQSGDIDVYTGKDFKKSCEILKREASSSEEKGEKHFTYQWHGTRIENHYHLILLTNHNHQKAFDGMLSSWFPSKRRSLELPDGDIFVPPLQFDVLLILEHLFHHFIHGGVGLRHVMDGLFVMKAAATDSSFDRIRFLQDLKSLELFTFAELLGAMAVDVFGFLKEQLPFEKTAANPELEKRMLDDILAGGDFGQAPCYRPGGFWRGRWYCFTTALHRVNRFRALAPKETKFYAWYRIKHFLLNFIKF